MRSRRAGFTLVEMLVVSLIGTVVLASVYKTLSTQERSVRQSYAVIGTQQNTRIAIRVLAGDLREVSATDGDITLADSTVIGMRALRKAGVVCNADVAGAWIDVAEVGDRFQDGDSIVVFSDNNPNSVLDDTWLRRRITGASVVNTCPGFPVSGTIRHLTVGVALAGVLPGGLVRSYTNIRYRLVDNGSNASLTRITPTDSTALLEEMATVSKGGLRFRYWDTASVAIPYNQVSARLDQIGRIQVKASGRMVGGQTGNRRDYSDSLVSMIQIRGNRKLR